LTLQNPDYMFREGQPTEKAGFSGKQGTARMVLFNYSTKELTAKIVYYGPGLCGKTTNLQFIHGNLPETVKGKMLSLATKTDRTLFFDFLPIDLGQIRGMKTRVQLYTVPGQVFYNETRKLVLKGADGIVFVADSQQQMLAANAESFKNLEENLKGHGMILAEMPHVIQFNKRDLPGLASIEEMNTGVNKFNAPFYETVATTGIGVQDTLKAITKLVLLHLTKKYDPRTTGKKDAVPAAPAAGSIPSVSTTPSAPSPTSSTDSIPLAVPTEMPGMAAEADVATPMAAMPVTPVPPAAVVADPENGSPEFDESEIDGLMDEVEESQPQAVAAGEPVAATPAVQQATPGFEIDASGIALEEPTSETEAPEEVEEIPLATPQLEVESIDTDAIPMVEPEMPAESASVDDLSLDDSFDALETPDGVPVPMPAPATAVELTELATDNDLFQDPDLDIARLQPGDERAIVVPVEMKGPDGETRRFKLSLSLRLDPVEDPQG